MSNKEPKLVRIPLKTEQEFYKRNIPVFKIIASILGLAVITVFLVR